MSDALANRLPIELLPTGDLSILSIFVYEALQLNFQFGGQLASRLV